MCRGDISRRSVELAHFFREIMRNVDFINNLKLRVAYTMTGNGNLPVYANRTYFTSSLVANDAVGVVLSNIGNEKLRWETTGRANVGFDF